ncbi:MAG: arginase [Zetaproteobacteria bacterium]|nr:arginase [Pseudobdellovibrionaceae bacterium]
MVFKKKKIEVIGVSSDLGANIPGASLGPSWLRAASLHEILHAVGLETSDLGDLTVVDRGLVGKEHIADQYRLLLAELLQNLAERTYLSMKNNNKPLILGGDHSLSIGSVGGVQKYFIEQGKSLGLVWFDAHADMNRPESSPSGNLHGMPVSVLLGKGHEHFTDIIARSSFLLPENIVLIGLRDVDNKEQQILEKSGVLYFRMDDVFKLGIESIMSKTVNHLKEKVDAVHISFDMDAIDPLYAPGVSTPVPNGLMVKDALLALEMLSSAIDVQSMDLVELNPLKDQDQKTAQLAVDLIKSAIVEHPLGS